MPRSFDLGPDSDEEEAVDELTPLDPLGVGCRVQDPLGAPEVSSREVVGAAPPEAMARLPSALERRQARARFRDGRASGEKSERDGAESASASSPRLPGGSLDNGAPANAGCMPGTDLGMGEGLSALFVHPDDDFYDLTEGGGILAEPPRTFEALAFVPRVDDASEVAHRIRLQSPEESDELVAMFASAAALGAHRTAPRLIRCADVVGGPGHSSSLANTWQMWVSENLTEAIGVPPPTEIPDGVEGTPVENPEGEQGRRRESTASTPAKGKKAKDKEAVDHAAAALTAGIKSAVELAADSDFRRMHIDYKGVVSKRGRHGADNVGEAEADRNDPETKKRAAAANLFKRSNSPTERGPAKGRAPLASAKPAAAKKR